MKYFLILSMLICSTKFVFGEASLESFGYRKIDCRNEKLRIKFWLSLISDTKKLKELIETVPPDTSKYFSKETELYLKNGNFNRYKLIMVHNFFPAFEVHYAAKKLLSYEKYISSRIWYKTKDKSYRYTNKDLAVRALHSYTHFDDFMNKFFKYLEIDNTRKNRILNITNKALSRKLYFLRSNYKKYAECTIKAIDTLEPRFNSVKH